MVANKKKKRRSQRIVLSGGPAAGKTAIIEVLRRHLGDQVAVLPEAASILFGGGFPRPTTPAGRRMVQHSIFQVQRSLEGIFALNSPEKPHICDRGGLDGAAYWPGGLERFLGAMGTTLESEYGRYDAVLFLESSAHGKGSYPTDSTLRIESQTKARKIDMKLREVWQDHPSFHLISHETNFYEKVAAVLITLHRVLGVGEPASALPQVV